MNLEDFFSMHPIKEILCTRIKEDIRNNSFNLDQLDVYTVDIDENDDITEDSEHLFNELLTRKIKVLHILNLKHNHELFKSLSIEVDGDWQWHEDEDDLVDNIIGMIVLQKLLSCRDEKTQVALKCEYCDNILPDNVQHCPVCDAPSNDRYQVNVTENDFHLSDDDDDQDTINIGDVSSMTTMCPYCNSRFSRNNSECDICHDNTGKVSTKSLSSNKRRTSWKCELCSTENTSNYKECHICNTSSPYFKTWRCKICSAMNGTFSKECCGCKETYNIDYASIDQPTTDSINIGNVKANEHECRECGFKTETGNEDNFNWSICGKCNVLTIKMCLDNLRIEEYQADNVKEIIKAFQKDLENKLAGRRDVLRSSLNGYSNDEVDQSEKYCNGSGVSNDILVSLDMSNSRDETHCLDDNGFIPLQVNKSYRHENDSESVKNYENRDILNEQVNNMPEDNEESSLPSSSRMMISNQDRDDGKDE